jgi:hypothetical protein
MISSDRIHRELAAMQTIADALSGLNDDARQRVLRWMSVQFASTTPAAVVQSADARPVMRTASAGPSEDLESLESFFDARPSSHPADDDLVVVEETPAVVQQRPGNALDPLTAMLESLVSDFKQLAREWRAA